MNLLFPFLAGVLFGLGLMISGMTNPALVLAFLDITGAWNPTLAFVMMGAIPVAWVGFKLLKRCEKPVCAPTFAWPTAKHVDAPLLVGSVVFGVGWGLAGYCPGPVLASLAFFQPELWAFAAAFVVGTVISKIIQQKA